MAGKYSGGYHGTGDFEFTATTGAEIARNHAILQANAARNRARANAGSDRVVQKKDVVKKTKAKKPKRPAAGSGPGNVVVGSAPTTGAGQEVVYQYAPLPLDLEGPAAGWGVGETAQTGVGPGNPGVGAVAGLGPGNGEVFVGPALPPALKNEDNDVNTAVKGAGVWIQPSGHFSDMSAWEDAYGDDNPLLWVIGGLKLGADLYHTANVLSPPLSVVEQKRRMQQKRSSGW